MLGLGSVGVNIGVIILGLDLLDMTRLERTPIGCLHRKTRICSFILVVKRGALVGHGHVQ